MGVRTKEHRESTLGDFIKLIHEEKMLVNDPCFLRRLLTSMLIRNKANKIIPRKESLRLLHTQSLIRRKKGIYRREIHYVLHPMKTIFWIHARFSWKRL